MLAFVARVTWESIYTEYRLDTYGHAAINSASDGLLASSSGVFYLKYHSFFFKYYHEWLSDKNLEVLNW